MVQHQRRGYPYSYGSADLPNGDSAQMAPSSLLGAPSPAQSYQLQYQTNLFETNWIDLGSPACRDQLFSLRFRPDRTRSATHAFIASSYCPDPAPNWRAVPARSSHERAPTLHAPRFTLHAPRLSTFPPCHASPECASSRRAIQFLGATSDSTALDVLVPCQTGGGSCLSAVCFRPSARNPSSVIRKFPF